MSDYYRQEEHDWKAIVEAIDAAGGLTGDLEHDYELIFGRYWLLLPAWPEALATPEAVIGCTWQDDQGRWNVQVTYPRGYQPYASNFIAETYEPVEDPDA